MSDASDLLTPVDVAICDPDVMWRVTHMNAVRGVNVREFSAARDAMTAPTPGHPMVLVVGPTSTPSDVAAVHEPGAASEIRLLMVGRSDAGGGDQVLPASVGGAAFATAVLDLLALDDAFVEPPGIATSGPAADDELIEPGPEFEVHGVGPAPGAGTDGGALAAAGYDFVIVPFDGSRLSRRATLVGADLSHLLGAELVIMTAQNLGGPNAISDLKKQAIALSDHKVTIWIEPRANEADALATMLRYRPRSLICMASSGRTGVRRVVYGSTAERLLHELDAPILVIGPHWAGASLVDLRHLVVCVDGSTTAEGAIPLAAAWASMMPLDATVLHVDTGDDAPAVDLDRLAAPLEEHCEIVDRLTVEHHDPVTGIVDVVQHSISPVVVMATHARSGVDRMLHGSMTADLISRCPVPVLVQRSPLVEIPVDEA